MVNVVKHKKTLLVWLTLLTVFCVPTWVAMTTNELQTAFYQLPTGLSHPIRIVHLSDLHSWEFGEGNQELVGMVTEQSPDLILMTGDMLDKSDEDAAVACALIKDLAEIAPVYYGYGNHEKAWERENSAYWHLP